MWNYYDYQHVSNTYLLNDHNVRLSIGLRQGLSFGFYYSFGKNWPSLANYTSQSTDPLSFAADYYSVLLAPYTGIYFFYMTSDDSAKLYGKLFFQEKKYYSAETLLLTTSYSADLTDFYGNGNGVNGKKSIGVSLKRGDRYHLRVRLVNTGGPDFLQLAMRIDLNYDTKGVLIDYANSFTQQNVSSNSNLEQRSTTPTSSSFSHSFLRHHSVKAIHVFSLSIEYRKEIQVFFLIIIIINTMNIIIIIIFLRFLFYHILLSEKFLYLFKK
jgi:hypothetical protein